MHRKAGRLPLRVLAPISACKLFEYYALQIRRHRRGGPDDGAARLGILI